MRWALLAASAAVAAITANVSSAQEVKREPIAQSGSGETAVSIAPVAALLLLLFLLHESAKLVRGSAES